VLRYSILTNYGEESVTISLLFGQHVRCWIWL